MNYAPLLLYLATTSITPGPNNLMCMYLGANYGLRGSRKFLIGSMGSVFIKALLCGLLNVLLASYVPKIIPYLKWIGALYMLWLAFSMIRSACKKEETAEKQGESTYLSGILLQCLNMKSWVAAISVFSVYVVPYTSSLTAVAAVAVIMLVMLITASLCWCLFGRAIQRVYLKWRLPISILMALSLIFCAWTAIQ